MAIAIAIRKSTVITCRRRSTCLLHRSTTVEVIFAAADGGLASTVARSVGAVAGR
ncbi:unnamed protein product [Cuscuta epithymum]|uniref:Uncharacterized protein n=1 Tax=Cuscuta epithymum TaxID=186058 RepID=A0AAV0DMU6_9ASTE|nr:unnamed protein product [Cuscuta epithymum]